VLNLNKNKNHFKEIESKFKDLHVICEDDEEYEMTQEDLPSRKNTDDMKSTSSLKVKE